MIPYFKRKLLFHGWFLSLATAVSAFVYIVFPPYYLIYAGTDASSYAANALQDKFRHTAGEKFWPKEIFKNATEAEKTRLLQTFTDRRFEEKDTLGGLMTPYVFVDAAGVIDIPFKERAFTSLLTLCNFSINSVFSLNYCLWLISFCCFYLLLVEFSGSRIAATVGSLTLTTLPAYIEMARFTMSEISGALALLIFILLDAKKVPKANILCGLVVAVAYLFREESLFVAVFFLICPRKNVRESAELFIPALFLTFLIPFGSYGKLSEIFDVSKALLQSLPLIAVIANLVLTLCLTSRYVLSSFSKFASTPIACRLRRKCLGSKLDTRWYQLYSICAIIAATIIFQLVRNTLSPESPQWGPVKYRLYSTIDLLALGLGWPLIIFAVFGWVFGADSALRKLSFSVLLSLAPMLYIILDMYANQTNQWYWLRRFIPFVFPLAAVGFALLIGYTHSLLSKKITFMLAGILFFGVLFGNLEKYQTQEKLNKAGLNNFMQGASLFPEESIIIMNRDHLSKKAQLPLRTLWGHYSYVTWDSTPERIFDAFMVFSNTSQRPIFIDEDLIKKSELTAPTSAKGMELKIRIKEGEKRTLTYLRIR